MKVRDSVCPPGPSTIWSVVISGLQENAAATALENFAHSEVIFLPENEEVKD